MTDEIDMREFEEQNNRFDGALRHVVGNVWKKPVPARLGYQDETGEIHVEVETERTDQPFKYYFSEAGGQSKQGEAFLAANALEKWQIKFGAPILVRKHVLTDEWEITGVDSKWAAQFFEGSEQDDGVIISYPKLSPGLLTQTNPPSMRCLILEGSYGIGAVRRIYETQSTVDWSQTPYNANIPVINLRQKYVLIQIDFLTGVLDYKYGAEINSSITPIQAYKQNLALGDDSILPALDTGYFRCGYVRLIKGMTRITKANIWPLQDYLVIGSGLTDAYIAIDSIVTSEGEVVVDSITGNVVYYMEE